MSRIYKNKIIRKGYKSAAICDRIVLVGARLFSQQGFHATSLQHIADVAKVNKASINYYFGSKDGLLFEIVTEVIEALLDLTKPIEDLDVSPAEKLRILVIGHVRWVLSNVELARTAGSAKKELTPRYWRQYVERRHQYEQIFVKVLDEGIASGELHCNNSKITTLFLLGYVNSVLQWYKPNGPLSAEEFISEVWIWIWRSIIKD